MFGADEDDVLTGSSAADGRRLPDRRFLDDGVDGADVVVVALTGRRQGRQRRRRRRRPTDDRGGEVEQGEVDALSSRCRSYPPGTVEGPASGLRRDVARYVTGSGSDFGRFRRRRIASAGVTVYNCAHMYSILSVDYICAHMYTKSLHSTEQ